MYVVTILVTQTCNAEGDAEDDARDNEKKMGHAVKRKEQDTKDEKEGEEANIPVDPNSQYSGGKES